MKMHFANLTLAHPDILFLVIAISIRNCVIPAPIPIHFIHRYIYTTLGGMPYPVPQRLGTASVSVLFHLACCPIVVSYCTGVSQCRGINIIAVLITIVDAFLVRQYTGRLQWLIEQQSQSVAEENRATYSFYPYPKGF